MADQFGNLFGGGVGDSFARSVLERLQQGKAPLFAERPGSVEEAIWAEVKQRGVPTLEQLTTFINDFHYRKAIASRTEAVANNLASLTSAAPGPQPEVQSGAQPSTAAAPPAFPHPGPTTSWQDAFEKWDKAWDVGGASQQGIKEEDYPTANELEDDERLNKILDMLKDLTADVRNIQEIVEDQKEAGREPGIGNDGHFTPGGPRPLGHAQPTKGGRAKQAFRNIGAEVIRAAASLGL